MHNTRWLTALLIISLASSGCQRHYCSVTGLREQNYLRDEVWLEGNEPEEETSYTLSRLIDLALCHNLDLLIKKQEIEVAHEVAFGSLFKMLPNLIGSLGRNARNVNTAAFSESLQIGIPPAPLSISLESAVTNWNVLLSWSVLDFGVAFFRSKQEQDRYAIKQFQYWRARNKVILDVVQAYWKVVATKKWIDEAEELLARTQKYKEQTVKQLQLKWISDLTAWESAKRLIDIEKDLMINTREHHSAKMGLANLVGFNPCKDFDVTSPDFQLEDIAIDDCKVLVETALRNRPELYEKDMEGQISMEQINEAIVQLLPNFRGLGNIEYNSNRFLLYNNWVNIGYELTWNLLQVPYWWMQQQVALADGRRISAERLASSLAIMAQVQLSSLLVEDFTQEYLLYKEDFEVKRELSIAAQKRVKNGEFHQMQAIIYEADALLAEIDALKAFASLQGAIEQLNNSIGIPLYYGSQP